MVLAAIHSSEMKGGYIGVLGREVLAALHLSARREGSDKTPQGWKLLSTCLKDRRQGTPVP